MMNLSRIKEKFVERFLPRGDLREVVYNAISELRPYFGLSEEEFRSLKLPKVKRGEEAYLGKNNTIFIPSPDCKPEFVGEEVGHWGHCQLNPELWRDCGGFLTIGKIRLINLREYVGGYAGLVLAELRGIPPSGGGTVNPLYHYQDIARSDFMKRGPSLLEKVVHAQSLEELEKIRNPGSTLQEIPTYWIPDVED